jgi:hypothetical protein
MHGVRRFLGVSAPPPVPLPPGQRVGVDPGVPCGEYVGLSAPPPPPPGQLLGGQASPGLSVQQLLSRPPENHKLITKDVEQKKAQG